MGVRVRTAKQVRRFGVLAVLLVCIGLATVPGPASAAGNKVTICHRTHSTKNPYRRIDVGVSAVNGSSTNDHTHHTGPLFDPTYTYPPNAKVWGDVIPDSKSGGAGAGLNWTTAGKAMFAAAGCAALTAQEFYNVEREAGVPASEILVDLADQGADADAGVTL